MLRGRETPKAEREKIIMKHQAYNIYTGELITSTSAKAVQRRVAQANRWDVKYGFREVSNRVVRSWRFSHNGGFVR